MKSMRGGLCVVMPLMLAATAAAAGDIPGWTLRAVAVTGEQAAGTEPGVVYSSFLSYLGFAMPRLDEEGRISISARLEGPGVADHNRVAMWIEEQGELRLLVRTGDPAPGMADGLVIAGLPDSFGVGLSAPPLVMGYTAVAATLGGPGVSSSNDAAVWIESDGVFDLLVREGDAAPLNTGTASFISMTMPALDAAGHAAFAAQINGAGVNQSNDEGFWTDRSGAMELLMREGDPAPGTEPGVVFAIGELGSSPYPFPFALFNDLCQTVIQANLNGPGIDYYNDQAIYLDLGDGPELFLREGDPAPGFGQGVTFGGGSIDLALYQGSFDFNDLGQLAFNIRLGGAIPTTTVLFSTHTGQLAPVVMPGDPAPGTSGHLGLVTTPVLSNDGRLAFRASLLEDGSYPPFGLWMDVNGQLEAVAVPGQPLAGGATLVSVSFIRGFTSSGSILFIGTVDDPHIGATSALLLAQGDAEPVVLIRRGEPIDVHGDGTDLRTVDWGGIHLAIDDAINESGVIAVGLEFEDGSAGAFVLTPDEPGPLADADGDGDVDVDDLVTVLLAWGGCPADPQPCPADVDGSGTVDVDDLVAVVLAWGT